MLYVVGTLLPSKIVCMEGTLLRSLEILSGFKILNDLVLMIVCSLLIECLLRTTKCISINHVNTALEYVVTHLTLSVS